MTLYSDNVASYEYYRCLFLLKDKPWVKPLI